MSTFRIALSGDFEKEDGSPAFPMFDLSKLDADTDIEWEIVNPVDGRMTATSLRGFDALILLAAEFDANSIPDDNRLAIVARFGVGYDNVDVEACTAAGIAVAITPDGVRRPVAVSILTFILALSGKLFAKDALVREGPEGFARRGDHMGTGLVGRTLGSIGIGNIGAETFRMCKPLDMRFIGHDPWADPAVANELGIELVDLETVFRQSDFLTINVALTDKTHHIVNAENLSLMKPSAYIINTSRGPVIDQLALVEALRLGTIAGAGLDVFDPEPPQADDPLLSLDNVIVTPHALCWTDQCFANIGASDISQVLALMRGNIPEYLVNKKVSNNPSFQSKLNIFKSNFDNAHR